MTETTTDTRTPAPIEEIRAAVSRLREAAVTADETGWYSAEALALSLFSEDTRWIALMHPGLAEPLAAWLDSIADEVGRHEARGWDTGLTPLAGGHPLALARAINGTAS